METQGELAQYLSSGDLRGAGTWLVERHAHEVVGLCRAMVHDAHAAEDLAQEIFGRAFTSLGSFRGESSPRTWLLAIARNRCIDHLRSLKRDPWRGAPTGDGDPDMQPDQRPLPSDLISRRDQVASALRQLSEGERALVILRYRHGLEYRELADVFGLKEGAVRMRMSRALSRMRRALQPTMLEVPVMRALEQAGSEPEVDFMSAEESAAEPEEEATARELAAAPARAMSAAAPRRRAGLLGRLLGRREEDGAPAPHPLVAVLGLLDPGISGDLRERLLEQIRAL